MKPGTVLGAVVLVAAIGVGAALLGLRDADGDQGPFGAEIGEPVPVATVAGGEEPMEVSRQRMERGTCARVVVGLNGARGAVCVEPGDRFTWSMYQDVLVALVTDQADRVEFEYFDGRVIRPELAPFGDGFLFLADRLPPDGNVRYYRAMRDGSVLVEFECRQEDPKPFGSSGCTATARTRT